jgi:hypothetical protein
MRALIGSFFIILLLAGVLAVPVPDAHAIWSRDGLAVATTGLNFQPSIVSDGAGGSIITWHGGAGSDIFAQRLTSLGLAAAGWPADGPLVVCAVAGLQENPVVVPDLAGGALFFWQDARNGSNYDIYAQHITAAGQPATYWQPGGNAISAAANNQYAPAAVSDSQGGAIVVWYDSRNGTGNYDIYAQRVLGNADPPPGSWPTSAGLRVCGAINHQINPSIVADKAGGAFIAWQDYRKGNEYDIYVQHVTGNGTLVLGWPVDGLGVCLAPNSQYTPVLANDGADGVFVAWQDYRSGTDNHIFAQHLTSGGACVDGWPADGRPVCQAPNSQFYPVLASDGGGGVFAAWQDYRSGVDNDIFAQHLTSSGDNATGWRDDGLSTCSAVNGQFSPRITGDAAGGAFIAWHDSRGGSTDDIYAQQVSGAGQWNELWPKDGFPLCRAPNSQMFPVIASSGVGGAVVAWQDQRTGEVSANAIYAQQALSADQAGVGSSPLRASGVGHGWPNPFRTGIQIQLTLSQPGWVNADVYDITGRRVKVLASQFYPAGTHALAWDGSTARGGPAADGVYFVRVRWPGCERTQRIVRLR